MIQKKIYILLLEIKPLQRKKIMCVWVDCTQPYEIKYFINTTYTMTIYSQSEENNVYFINLYEGKQVLQLKYYLQIKDEST